jgi:hypothetical protein
MSREIFLVNDYDGVSNIDLRFDSLSAIAVAAVAGGFAFTVVSLITEVLIPFSFKDLAENGSTHFTEDFLRYGWLAFGLELLNNKLCSLVEYGRVMVSSGHVKFLHIVF